MLPNLAKIGDLPFEEKLTAKKEKFIESAHIKIMEKRSLILGFHL
ncbi:hypothetical protein VIBNISO65_730002 [Vibrio nigripulchritudo SO65]|uniref:Uncharacterized protein n=1 Tax=Vibrio nigripulchritudo SOn1 TaxID=1238450 RepID=A0AAV2VSN7_9VIBR|nr:hypothetical protein VIBNIAM115_280004 [Vibrio nigripulchritudo AM115]CCN44391.1 hypothetical protein VIBNIFTn2_760004 [Vibrio nigripulchritudo FTn2]CCN63339.1 hypothetical protein VIBNIPon4_1210004 [Vibrio nigripulchritudo POn4]CCN78721.1 hypothetical protein VIBNISO65_730002 [Vibrio nigripulchritudo SO65]CCO47691.1 hypothetical protein VIBNISOn1_340006 [Vibrio nigripulchritudo SOn1]